MWYSRSRSDSKDCASHSKVKFKRPDDESSFERTNKQHEFVERRSGHKNWKKPSYKEAKESSMSSER